MAKQEKAKKEKEEEEERPDESEEGSDEKKGGLGLIPIALAAIVVAGGAGAGAYFFAPGQSGETAPEETVEDSHHSDGDDAEEEKPKNSEHAKKEKKKKKKKKKKDGGDKAGAQKVAGGAFEVYEDVAYFLLDPFVISIQPIGRTRHLKISIVLETSPEHEETLIAHSYRIRDVINIYLRSVDGAELENPAAMTRLKTQIKRRVRLIMADDAVENVLITEFILT